MSENRALQGLYDRVVARDLCTACGACASLCPYLRSFEGRIVRLDQCDIEEGRCFAYCPRTEVDLEAIHEKLLGETYDQVEMGRFRSIFMARSTDRGLRQRAQAGGVVSALIRFALDDGFIDSAILTHRDEDHLPGGRDVRTGEEVLACAGSSYVAGPTLEALNRREWKDSERIGVVGTPCQVLALAKMKASNLEQRTPVRQVGLVVGLFCTWAFRYGPFLEFLRNRTGAAGIGRLDISPPPERLLKVSTENGTLEIPLDEVRPFIRPACRVCPDMTAELSDVSVGTVEGRMGWNTVVVRTDTGEEAVGRAEAAGVLETRPLPGEDLAHLKEASLLKKRRALKALEEKGELNGGYLRLSPGLIKKIVSGSSGEEA